MSEFKPWSMAEYERHKDIKPMDLSCKNESFIYVGNNERAKTMPSKEKIYNDKTLKADDNENNVLEFIVDLLLELIAIIYLICKIPFSFIKIFN